jgi:hypothetical protein
MPEAPSPTRQEEWIELVVPYRDTRAQELCWSLALPVLPALATRTVRLGGLVLELRLLGASHQVLAWDEDGTELLCAETVACLPGPATPLPPHAERPLPAGGYALRSTVRTLAPDAFDAAVAGIRAAVAAGPAALGGSYPGAPGALTAVLPEPARAGVRWTTWHSYPQDGRLVRTRTGFRRTLSPRQRGSSGDQGEGLDGVRSYGAGSPPVAVVSCHRP